MAYKLKVGWGEEDQQGKYANEILFGVSDEGKIWGRRPVRVDGTHMPSAYFSTMIDLFELCITDRDEGTVEIEDGFKGKKPMEGRKVTLTGTSESRDRPLETTLLEYQYHGNDARLIFSRRS